jgi:hypothetical protein
MSESPPRETDENRTTVPVRDRVDGYYRNGTWVARDANPDPRPPSWRERLEARFGSRWKERRFWLPAAGVLVVLILLMLISAGGSPATAPETQQKFLDAVKRGQTAVRDGNDITLVTAARDRASDICAELRPRRGVVEGWVGTLEEVGTVFGGNRGEVSVALGNDVKVHTWSRESEDTKDKTLVDPNSDVYRDLADLESGDKVTFSGVFVPRGAACFQETSVFDRNGMLTPGFIFRFTAVAPR